MLNKAKGNMYPWVTHTWNTVKGKCPHDCIYCYMKRFPQKDIRIDVKELTVDLGVNNFIFIGSSCDMWAEHIPSMWVEDTLAYCEQFYNKYLFQSKNPKRFASFHFPPMTTLGITLESNREWDGSKAPRPWERVHAFKDLLFPKMVSIEPIMDFDLDLMVNSIKAISPQFVSIGADSGNNHLPEPSPVNVRELIKQLEQITEVKVKANLNRLLATVDKEVNHAREV